MSVPAIAEHQRGTLWPFYSTGIPEALARCLYHGDLGTVDGHPAIAEFETAFKKTLRLDGDVASYNSGTSAYCAGLFALNLPKASEIIVPRRTFRATITPLLQFGLVPRFADCNQADGGISADAVRQLITPKTAALVVTHQWGQPASIAELRELADARGIRLIEDCSHAHGCEVEGRPVGTFGDFSFFSCGTTKLVSGGTAGVFTSSSRALYERALLYGQPKRRCRQEIRSDDLRAFANSGVGTNLRANPFAAVLAMDHLHRLDRTIETKNRNLSELDEIIARHCPNLRPMPRSSRWTRGTWYKRPFHVVRGSATALLAAGKQCGLDLGLQDPFMNASVSRLAEWLGVALPPGTVDESSDDGLQIVLLGTRDLYSDEWDRPAYIRQLSALQTATS